MATGDHDWTAGEQVTAANMDDYLQLQVVQQFATAAARDTALSARKREGMVTYQIDTNTLTVYSGAAWSTIGPAHGGLTAWTPAIVQSVSVSSTGAGGYSRIGRMVYFQAVVTCSSAGTAANAVTISLPVAATTGYGTYYLMGNGSVADVSAVIYYAGVLRYATSTTVKIQVAGTADPAYLGVASFTAALASGDIISVNGCYEAGADA